MRLLVIDPREVFPASLWTSIAGTIEVVRASSIAEAGERLRSSRPDLVLCGLDDESVQFMSAAREQFSGAEFVFAHAADDTSGVAAALRVGALHCLSRPIEPEIVRVLVRHAVERREMRERTGRIEERTRRELAEGRRLQRAMMPAAAARVGGMSVAVRTRPSTELGGDLVDYAEAGPDRAAVIIADVAGHGLSAAMLTTLVKSAFRNAAPSGFAPRDVAANVADAIRPFDDWRFVTLITARIDRAAKQIEYVNAGHPAAWVFQRGQILSKLGATGPLISSGVDGAPEASTAPLPEHAGILMYTDGITDANTADCAARFGAARLEEALSRGRGGGESLLDAIFQSVDAFTGGQPVKDDMTALTLTIGLPGIA